METFDKLTKLVHSIPKLHEAGYKKGKEDGYKAGHSIGYDKGKVDGVAEYVSKYKPTLNAPLISVNVSNAVLNVSDYRNGNFTTEYLLYRNGELVNTFTSKSINLTEYMTVNGDETIQVKCAENEFFNESEISNGLVWQDICDGTPGLTYSGKQCTGWGTVNATEVRVASIVNGVTITEAKGFGNNNIPMTVIFPDTITIYGGDCFYGAAKKYFIFGSKTQALYGSAFLGTAGTTLDFRRATLIPTITSWSYISQCKRIIVPDNLYDDWIIATNWSAAASKIIRATDYEAQQGGAT